MKKIILLALVFGLSIFTSIGYALDVEDSVKNYEKHGNWASFSIVDVYFGRTLAARATTEDERTNATLALTYPVNNRCKLTPIDIIVKLPNPVREESSWQAFGNLQLDGNPTLKVEATIQNEENSNFTFITIDRSKIDKELSVSKSLMVNFKGYGVMNFSLDGAKSAIDRALNSCNQFSF